jgi:hypothetical protein
MMAEEKISLQYGLRFKDADTDPDGILILDLRTAEVSKASVARRNRVPKIKAPPGRNASVHPKELPRLRRSSPPLSAFPR